MSQFEFLTDLFQNLAIGALSISLFVLARRNRK